MIQTLTREITFQRSAIALIVLGVAGLYALVAADHFSSPAAAPPATKQNTTAVPAPSPLLTKPVQVTMVGSAEKLFDLINYRLDSVRRHGNVPRVFLASLPSRLPEIRRPSERKVIFIKTTLPLILHVNELIQQDRAEIEALYAKQKSGAALTDREISRLQAVARTYGLNNVDMDELLRRVDIIPPSLALAQSAEESGWGTSRFAREGNALFGQRTFRSDKGIVPKGRAKGATYMVRAFDHLIDGVKSYALNLNTHAAYRKFRATRSVLRQGGKTLDGHGLAEEMTAYSERGRAYVKTIQSIIRVNDFDQFDKVRLGDRLSIDAARPGA